MYNAIHFPNLGVQFENVGQSVSIFGFEVAYYGIVIGIGMVTGILLACREAKRTEQNVEIYYDLAMIGIIVSIIGARIYYVVFQWESYKNDLLSIFNLREGGLAIYGGIIAAVITVIVYCKVKKQNMFCVFDTVALPLLAGQIIGRWGNFFNREVFGEYTDNLFAMRLPVERVRFLDITEKIRENIINMGGVDYIQVHPTFLYESMWNLGVFLILWFYRKHKKFEGELFLLYIFGYSAGRIWIEGVRTDQLLLPYLGWPVSQVLAGILMIVTGMILVVSWSKYFIGKKHKTV